MGKDSTMPKDKDRKTSSEHRTMHGGDRSSSSANRRSSRSSSSKRK
jgi:hypothetical protein